MIAADVQSNRKKNLFTGAIDYVKDLAHNIRQYKYLYLFILPCIIFYVLFWVMPLYGIEIAFKDLNPALGISKSPWVGFRYFTEFFTYWRFKQLMLNTIGISLLKIAFGFSAPILLALMINEIGNLGFKRIVQTISYLPHFVSWVIIANIIYRLLAYDGIVNDVLVSIFGVQRDVILVNPNIYWPMFIITDIWKEVGFGSIIYLAAISAIDSQVYEAAKVDGAGRFRRIWNVTLPGIFPTIVILFILRVGGIMQAGFDQIYTLRNPSVSDATDVLDVYVAIMGLQRGQYGYGAAVGLFTGIVSLILMVTVNKIASKYSDTSLW